jgi:hypothetical protein
VHLRGSPGVLCDGRKWDFPWLWHPRTPWWTGDIPDQPGDPFTQKGWAVVTHGIDHSTYLHIIHQISPPTPFPALQAGNQTQAHIKTYFIGFLGNFLIIQSQQNKQKLQRIS